VSTRRPGKITRRVRARLAGDRTAFDGYEIHVGRTRADATVAPFAVIVLRRHVDVSALRKLVGLQ
jgi:hypothetical protein